MRNGDLGREKNPAWRHGTAIGENRAVQIAPRDTHMIAENTLEQRAHVGLRRLIAAILQGGWFQAGPVGLHDTAFDGATQQERSARRSMIGSAIAVRRGGAFLLGGAVEGGVVKADWTGLK